jgi:hypothetical protein
MLAADLRSQFQHGFLISYDINVNQRESAGEFVSTILQAKDYRVLFKMVYKRFTNFINFAMFLIHQAVIRNRVSMFLLWLHYLV